MTDTTTLEGLVSALDRAAAALRAGDLDAEAAAKLVESCAQTAGDAAAELDRLLRAATQDPIPGQDSLL